MKQLFIVILFFSLSMQGIKAQPGTKWEPLKGKVLNVSMRTPIKAAIILESMPYGGDNRVFSSKEEDGTFSFKVKQGKEYKVRVEAEGYLSIEEVISITNGMKPLLYELIPSGENTLLRLNINFEEGNSDLVEESFPELDKLIAMLNEYQGMEIQLEGHTDFRGSATANIRLSEERVEAVKQYIISKEIDNKRISTKAFGGTQPLTRENTAEAKLTNRRVEARILKIE
ncbi:MAG: OOP family OmpA-OmpF porin [Marivirga sp.]|jgi:OOP family OmpA-OmpF porin